VFVKNTEEEAIPAFGCMRVTGVEVVGRLTAITVEKPTSTDGEFLFNGPYPIEAPAAAVPETATPEKLGVGWAYRYGTVVMLGDAPTAPNVGYGPVVDSWEVEEGGGQFTVFGVYEITPESTVNALTGRFNVHGDYAVILDADLPAASHALTGATSCLATVCEWDSTDEEYAETAKQITVWNHAEATAHVEDTFGIARWIDGHWHFFGDCEPMAAR
jgi:hypothetical protein